MNIEVNEHTKISFKKKISELLQEQILFTESIYIHWPIGIEIYNSPPVLTKN